MGNMGRAYGSTSATWLRAVSSGPHARPHPQVAVEPMLNTLYELPEDTLVLIASISPPYFVSMATIAEITNPSQTGC